MRIKGGSQSSLTDVILTGSAQEIYQLIQYEADSAIQYIRGAEQQNEIPPTKTKRYLQRLKKRLEEASHLRISLNKADRSIELAKKTDPILRKYALEISKAKTRDTLETLVDFLASLRTGSTRPSLLQTLPQIQMTIGHSLESRIKMAWHVNEILGIRRLFSIDHIIALTDRLTDIAILLENDKIIQYVETVLSKLNIPQSSKQPSQTLDLPIEQLKTILRESVMEIEQTYENIQVLNAQKQEIQKVTVHLNEMQDKSKIPSPSPRRKVTVSNNQPEPEMELPRKGMHSGSKREK